MVRHLSLLFCKIIEHVNHGQSPAVTGDQPVHELGNQAQFMHPLEFDKVIWMIGPSHIEMAFISAVGDSLEEND